MCSAVLCYAALCHATVCCAHRVLHRRGAAVAGLDEVHTLEQPGRGGGADAETLRGVTSAGTPTLWRGPSPLRPPVTRGWGCLS